MGKNVGFECPLCHSPLTQSRYLQVVGVWKERERFKASLKEKLAEARQAKQDALAFIDNCISKGLYYPAEGYHENRRKPEVA